MDVEIDVKKKAPGVYVNEKSVTMSGELVSEADRIKGAAELWRDANTGNGNPTVFEATYCDFNCDFDNDFLRCGCPDQDTAELG